jgi:hypothetical protein
MRLPLACNEALPLLDALAANESSTSPAIDFAAGWALQCTLSAQFAGDAQPRPLYTSEQVLTQTNTIICTHMLLLLQRRA